MIEIMMVGGGYYWWITLYIYPVQIRYARAARASIIIIFADLIQVDLLSE
jgi:hypothetical protein